MVVLLSLANLYIQALMFTFKTEDLSGLFCWHGNNVANQSKEIWYDIFGPTSRARYKVPYKLPNLFGHVKVF